MKINLFYFLSENDLQPSSFILQVYVCIGSRRNNPLYVRKEKFLLYS